MEHTARAFWRREALDYWKACRAVRRTSGGRRPEAPRLAVQELECSALHTSNSRIRVAACRLLSATLTASNPVAQRAAAAAVFNLYGQGIRVTISRGSSRPAPLGNVVSLAAVRQAKASAGTATASPLAPARSRRRRVVGKAKRSDVA